MKLSRDTRMTREKVAKTLTSMGYRISHNTLNNMASQRRGPPYEVWGRFAYYTWGSVIDWAENRFTAPSTATEHRTQTAA